MGYLLKEPRSGEVQYFNSLVQIKEHIESAAGIPEEYRIFKLEREIDVNNLFGPQKYE